MEKKEILRAVAARRKSGDAGKNGRHSAQNDALYLGAGRERSGRHATQKTFYLGVRTEKSCHPLRLRMKH